MSYHRQQGMSGLVDNLVNAASAAANIVRDPYLPETTALILKLHRLEQAKPRAGAAPAPAVQGIGLNKVVGPLRTYVKVRENPILLVLAAAGILLVPYWLGRTARRG